MHRFSLFLLLSALACSEEPVPPAHDVEPLEGGKSSWTLQPGSRIQWRGSKPMKTHVGEFERMSGFVDVENGDTLTAMEIQIEMASITSDDTTLTNHLKGDKWFRVADERFATSLFTLTSISADDRLKGELTLMGQTETILTPVELTWNENSLRVQSELTIDRTRWGVTEKSRVLGEIAKRVVDDDVELSVDLQFQAP